ncbi:MAG: LapA family protein [Deinococcus sp.]
MRFNVNTLLLALLALLLIVFIVPADNRNTLTAPHTVVIPGLGTHQGVPFGLYALLGWLLTALVYTLLNTFTRLRNQADSARLLREMESLRTNLDRAEGSRFAELQTYLERRLGELQTQVSAQSQNTGVAGLQTRVDTLGNELSADIGQLEDYLRRKLGE